MDTLEAIRRELSKWRTKATAWDERRRDLLAEIAALEEAGITDAHLYWRKEPGKQKRFLYLVHPQKNGQRRREYVGSDPGRVAEAKRMVDRYKLRTKRTQELAKINDQLTSLLRRLTGHYY